ncbi:MAG: site-specific integrase [Alphaproteobacteria bacterium]|nr:site-specific integrase [Alphaproteobacteria bacterium]
MSYVYKRPNGLFEVRFPIPNDLRGYFPKSDRMSFKTHIIVSLGTRDQAEANSSATSRFVEIEQKFSVLRDGVRSEHFRSFCQYVYDMEMELGSRRRLDSNRPSGVLDEDLRFVRTALENRSIDALEASVGWVVDTYFENVADAKAIVPTDTELRNGLLNAAADVMTDVYNQLAASALGHTHKPKIKATQLQPRPEPKVSAGENTPLSKEGNLSLEQYWGVHETIKQASSSPVTAHTLKRRRSAWKELTELLGMSTPVFQVKKADIWRYRDALAQVPSRAGSIIELRDLSFPKRVEAMKANPTTYKHLDLNSVGDRLRQISAVFQLAVDRGHLTNNPALGVSEGKKDKTPHRGAYTESELQHIFSQAPYDRPCRLDDQTDEFWVPLLELFLGARASELYVYVVDVHESAEVPHIRLVEYEERSLKNMSSARILPIHPELIELGFLDYCRRVRGEGKELFPKWKFRADQKPSEGPARRRFNRRVKVLLPDRKHPADSHTFRHTFETALSAADGVPERVARRLQGRAIEGSAAHYVNDFPLPVLAEAIGKVRFGSLSLKHLS